MNGRAYCFPKNDDNRDYAIQQWKFLQSHPTAQGVRVQAEGPVPIDSSREQDNEQKIAHCMACLSVSCLRKSFLENLARMW